MPALPSDATPFFRRGPSPFARFVFFGLLSLAMLFADARYGYLENVRVGVGIAGGAGNDVLASSDNVTATVTCKSVASPMDLDRTVRFTASVDGVPRVIAEVLFHDTAPGGLPDVNKWTYCRTTPCP